MVQNFSYFMVLFRIMAGHCPKEPQEIWRNYWNHLAKVGIKKQFFFEKIISMWYFFSAEFSPFLGIYKDSKLVGLSVLNQIDGNKQAAFSQSMYVNQLLQNRDNLNHILIFFARFEPLLQELTNQSSTIKESTLMTSLYISDNDRVTIYY